MHGQFKLLNIALCLLTAVSCTGERPDFSSGKGNLAPEDAAASTPDAAPESTANTEDSGGGSTSFELSETDASEDRATEGVDTDRIDASVNVAQTDGHVVTPEPNEPDAQATDTSEPSAPNPNVADTSVAQTNEDDANVDEVTDAGPTPNDTDGEAPAPDPALVSVELVLATDSLTALNESASFEVLCTYDNDSTVPCTATASINVGDTSIVELNSNTSAFVPVTNGTTVVTAIVKGMESEPATLSVDLGPICSTLRLTGAASGAIGTSVTWTATCDYDDGRAGVDVSDDVTWQSSSDNVASISSTGVLTAVSLGSATISASLNNPDENTTSVSRTFAVTGGVLVSVNISAVNASDVPAGLSTNLAAECVYTDVTTDCTTTVTWASSNLSVANLAVDGTATGNVVGTTDITASEGSITSNVLRLTVTEAVLVNVAVTPNSGVTAEVNTSRQLKATCTMSDGNVSTCTSDATWNASPSGVAAVDSSGQLFGLSDGTALVTATYQGIPSAAVAVTVVPPAGCENAINFPDEVMLLDVRGITGRLAGPIYYEDVKSVTSFEHNQNNGFLEFLTGIHCFTSLETLIVERAWLADISDVVGLIHIKALRFGFTSVRNVPELSLLTQLSEVDLSYTQITDLYALADAEQLGDGATVSVTGANLDCSDSWILDQIQTLESRGVEVAHDCSSE